MDLQSFLNQYPCLEALDGFRNQRLQDNRWTGEEQAAWLLYRDRLMRGLIIPAPTKLDQVWTYQKGKPPKRKRNVQAQ